MNIERSKFFVFLIMSTTALFMRRQEGRIGKREGRGIKERHRASSSGGREKIEASNITSEHWMGTAGPRAEVQLSFLF